jgi:hypothetical protein
LNVLAQDGLRTVAFKVCTAMERASVTAVLTGGSAATVYAPEAYQSQDLDFVLQRAVGPSGKAEEALAELGYAEERGTYVHHSNPLTLDFVPRPIQIGGEIIGDWDTLREDGMILHILSPTDCCRDRLAHFLHWNDRAGLAQAVAVAGNHEVDMDGIRSWCEREGQTRKYREFERALRPVG